MAEDHRIHLAGRDLRLDSARTGEFHIIVDFSEVGPPPAPAQAPLPSAAPQPYSPEVAAAPRSIQEIEQRSQAAISAAMNTIRAMALETNDMLEQIPGGAQPRMIKVKFGVQLNVELGAILAKSNAGATLEVELEWARRADDVLRVTTLGEDETGSDEP
jgi:hypothetical protein